MALFIIKRYVSNTLAFRENIEDSVPLLRFPLSISDVRHFPEEAPKFLPDFLTVSK